MSAYRPGFIRTGIDPSPPLVHEDPDQMIQGGLPGEHYHISAALLTAIIELATVSVVWEPVMTSAGEITTSVSGDIYMYELAVPTGRVIPDAIP